MDPDVEYFSGPNMKAESSLHVGIESGPDREVELGFNIDAG